MERDKNLGTPLSKWERTKAAGNICRHCVVGDVRRDEGLKITQRDDLEASAEFLKGQGPNIDKGRG